MKTLICLTLGLALVGCAHGQTIISGGPEWRATVNVVDESGQPIADAEIGIGYYIPPPTGQTIAMDQKAGHTDTNGIFITSAHSQSVDLEFDARKKGYYPTHFSYELGIEYDPIKWNTTQTLVLKKMVKPIPMYARRLNTYVPVLDKPVGFDFIASDWVAPFGKGISPDIIFTAHLDKIGDTSNYKLIVNFTNPLDGIQEFSAPAIRSHSQFSALRSPREAPIEGYQSEWVQHDSRKPGTPIDTNRDESRNFFFRVRTVVDESGKIKSALYGKIYGDFMRFDYYLNPISNDRNMEFDPKRNLLKALISTEQVDKP